jgi:SAM-dependent methyltransferase
MLEQHLYEITYNKKGLEIGGPSDNGVGIYMFADIIDNVIFCENTLWSNHKTNEYNYYDNKIGKVIISDAVDIPVINNETYDFIFSSHTLEHIANPLKAIKEWLRIVKKDGYIIIIVPEKAYCFDHKRDYSKFSTLLEQYEKNVGEDDLSTLKEILINHDLIKDKPAGTFLEFTKRCLDNYNNRCMHHYVYNDDLLLEICNYFNCVYVYHITFEINKWFIIKKNN